MRVPHYLNPLDPLYPTYSWSGRRYLLTNDLCRVTAQHMPKRLKLWVLVHLVADFHDRDDCPPDPYDATASQLYDDLGVD